jgi:hypothetical protein
MAIGVSQRHLTYNLQLTTCNQKIPQQRSSHLAFPAGIAAAAP